jgi:hypothetical protein
MKLDLIFGIIDQGKTCVETGGVGGFSCSRIVPHQEMSEQVSMARASYLVRYKSFSSPL